MEEINEAGETLTIGGGSRNGGEQKEYELIPEGVYEAEYQGLKTYMKDGKFGPKKKVYLKFKITSGPNIDKTTSFSSNMSRNSKTGEFYIDPKSELAKAIRVVTQGGQEISDSHKGAKVLIEVTHQKSQDGSKTWDFATNVMKAAQIGGSAPAPAKPAATAPAQTNGAAKTAAPVAAAAPAPAAPAKPSSDLLADLTELGDFKL